MKPARSIKYLLFAFLLSSAGYPLASYAGPVCGDGVVEGDEECDEGGDTPSLTCTNNSEQGDGPCTDTFCGDFVTQSTNGIGGTEACDDGPSGSTECTSDCSVVRRPLRRLPQPPQQRPRRRRRPRLLMRTTTTAGRRRPRQLMERPPRQNRPRPRQLMERPPRQNRPRQRHRPRASARPRR